MSRKKTDETQKIGINVRMTPAERDALNDSFEGKSQLDAMRELCLWFMSQPEDIRKVIVGIYGKSWGLDINLRPPPELISGNTDPPKRSTG